MKSPNPSTSPFKRLWLLALVGGASLAYYRLVRAQLLTFGCQHGESDQALVGDEIIMHPHLTLIHAQTIHAPLEVVWPWLAQMGREHVGLYVWDSIYNQGVRSAANLRPDLPRLAVGMRLNCGLQVLAQEFQQHLVIGGFNLPNSLGQAYDITYSYHLTRPAPTQTRLLLRIRLYAYGLSGLVYPTLAEPFYAAQAHLQLGALADRAQAHKAEVVRSKEKANGHQPIHL